MMQKLGKYVLVASLWGFGLAMAQSEPTLNQVYAAAQAGHLEQAQTMVQQVLISHPNSGKAYFVRSELFARQGDMAHARESLATAEKLAPGLPFAKPEAVQALRSELAAVHTARPVSSGTMGYAAAPGPAPSASWALPVLLAGGVMVLGYFIFRRRTQPAPAQYPGYGAGGLNGPQTFGAGGAAVMQPGYGQPTGSGLGGQILGGVATGLAVGAGVMAAEAIGHRLMGDHSGNAGAFDTGRQVDYQNLDANPDMGGADFGVNDAGSWDDGGGMDMGGGGWDS